MRDRRPVCGELLSRRRRDDESRGADRSGRRSAAPAGRDGARVGRVARRHLAHARAHRPHRRHRRRAARVAGAGAPASRRSPLYARGAEQAAVYDVPFEQPEPPDVALGEGDATLRCGSLALRRAAHARALAGPRGVLGMATSCSAATCCSRVRSAAPTCCSLTRCGWKSRSRGSANSTTRRSCSRPRPVTTIGHERASNAFLTGDARIARR